MSTGSWFFAGWRSLRDVVRFSSTSETDRLKSELATVIAQRQQTAALLRQSQELVQATNLDLARRVEEKTQEITAANLRLRRIFDSAMDAWVTVDDNQVIV